MSSDPSVGGPALHSEVIHADFFEKVGYSTVWEDERIIDTGLAPRPGERALSITSGADFSLQFLLHDVEVVSIDFNPRQNYLLHLKKACVAVLDHDAVWQLLGLSHCNDRMKLYQRLRPSMPAEAQRYWDTQSRDIVRGVLLCGKQDKYLHTVGSAIALIQGRNRVTGLFNCKNLQDQQEYFDTHWNGAAWKALTSLLFSRRILNMAFHKDHFRYARTDEHPATLLRRQAERALRDVPIRENFYLHWLFFRTYPDKECCPAWLRESNFRRLKEKIDRLSIHTAEVEKLIFEQPDQSIDCFNFSNIFDWVSTEAFIRLMGEVVRIASPGARLCYWTNTVNTRRELASAASVYPRIQEKRELADRIFSSCRTPGYSSCTVGIIC